MRVSFTVNFDGVHPVPFSTHRLRRRQNNKDYYDVVLILIHLAIEAISRRIDVALAGGRGTPKPILHPDALPLSRNGSAQWKLRCL